MPIGPAPRIKRRLGSLFFINIPVEDKMRSSSNSKPGIILGLEPVASSMALDLSFMTAPTPSTSIVLAPASFAAP
ncbi:MAG: hypothetical protein BWX81_01733 [Spirochaetes bacterium ADurb.Bin110]|nr:MAG: hypothetical protein BWX81_01733 [Spirochaetes bacterium ADurb.Bin110]